MQNHRDTQLQESASLITPQENNGSNLPKKQSADDDM